MSDRKPHDSERAKELERQALEASEASRKQAAEARERQERILKDFLADRDDDEDSTGVRDLRAMMSRPRENLPTVPAAVEKGELSSALAPPTVRPRKEPDPEEPAPPSSAGRVLVVDDDEGILQALCDVLRAERYSVADARDGYEALGKAITSRPPPDVILLDVGLPVLSGPAVAAALRIDRPELAESIVLISAATAREAPPDLVREFVFMGKPLNLDLLLDTVRARVEEGRARAKRPF